MGCGIRTSSPWKRSALQKPELRPLKTMRRTRETLAHGGLGYLLTLPCLDLSGLSANPSHPMTPVLLHLPSALGAPFIHRGRAVCPPHFVHDDLCPFSGQEFILTNDVLRGEFLFLCVCCLSLQTKGWASAIKSPSIYCTSTTARQTRLSSLPPTCIGLLSSHLCKY